MPADDLDVRAEPKAISSLSVRLLLFSLTLPFFFHVGPLFLSADRFVLLVMFVPCLAMWMQGRAGQIVPADLVMLSMWAWMTLSTMVIEGPPTAVEAGGINLIETMGAYLLARCFVRDADGFHRMVRFLFLLILLMFPFAIIETLTARNLLLEIANKAWTSAADTPKPPRWGLDRVGGPLSHPILFGVFCGSCFALSFFVLGYHGSRFKRFLRTSVVGLMAFLSLSSGPLAALIAQIGMISWDRLLRTFKKRWVFLTTSIAMVVIALEIAADRSTPQLVVDYFAFNKETAYNRLRIWDYGTQSVAKHPVFGIGFGEWERPAWMSGSMDMFWLVPAVRHGLPAGLLLQAAFFSLFIAIALKRNLSERADWYRRGYLICMVGFYLAGWTVHFWREIYVLFMFLMGSGVWILFEKPDQTARPTVAQADGSSAPTARQTWATASSGPSLRQGGAPSFARSRSAPLALRPDTALQALQRSEEPVYRRNLDNADSDTDTTHSRRQRSS